MTLQQASTVELSAGPVDYIDTGGGGPVLVLLHGLLMNASLWEGVVADLAPDHRCVVPTLPMGAHRHPMHPGADLSLPGIADLVAELLQRLDLSDATMVGNDTGGVLVQLLARGRDPRIGGIVLVSCEAFDNFPPGLTGRTLALVGKLPPRLFGLFMQQLRLRPLRRLPITFGWLTLRGDATTARWVRPLLRCHGIQRDAVRMLRAIAAQPDLLLEAAEDLPAFDRPALVVWASRDRVMPLEHGRRLAELLPTAALVEVDHSYTLVPLDQPTELAAIIRGHVTLHRTDVDVCPDVPAQVPPGGPAQQARGCQPSQAAEERCRTDSRWLTPGQVALPRQVPQPSPCPAHTTA